MLYAHRASLQCRLLRPYDYWRPFITLGLYYSISWCFLVSSRKFKCCLSYAKKSFYRAANAIFSKVCHLGFEITVIHLICSKCLPLLLYGFEACSLSKSDLCSLDFSVNRLCMKLFRTTNNDIILNCRTAFGVDLPSILLDRRRQKFMDKVCTSSNLLLSQFLH